MNVQVMLCGCGLRLEATHYEAPVAEVIEHLRADHPEPSVDAAGVRAVREIVPARSYRVEEGAVSKGTRARV